MPENGRVLGFGNLPDAHTSARPAPSTNRLGPETEAELEVGPAYWTGTDGIAGSS